MLDDLESLASRILACEQERRLSSAQIRQRHEDFFHPIDPKPANGYFGAVDGGLLSEEYQGFELVLVRAVGVRYEYNDGALVSVSYFPSALPDPKLFQYDIPVEEENIGPLRSLTRLLVEIGTALDFVRNVDLDYLFLDGSILPQLVDKPRGGGSELKQLYKDVIRTYRSLYKECSERGTVLAGVVKDSKGDRVATYLNEGRMRDPVWLKYAMNLGEMTEPIPYADNPSDQATLKDIGEDLASRVWIFYLKASDYDLPFRVEFYADSPDLGEELASILLPLSSANRMFTIPPFLLEADIRARLAQKSMAYIREFLEKRLGIEYNLFRMRGANKPF
ncbi:MAG: DNA double-strand break repair nuclease NurA [Candidatus Diapherotrites archaeon]|nr:DNA double-strand break repair nuclease NurA [Candidatus Diapherotrites archaeon]